MSKNKIFQNAKGIKVTLASHMKGKELKPLSQNKTPFHHPIAKSIKDKEITFSAKDREFIKQCEQSAKLIITNENYKILLNYFSDRRKANDKLGQLYQSLDFSSFVLRLFQKRFKEVYFDGRAVVLRNGEDHSGREGKAYLQKIGTQNDTNDIYLDYLTLEESVLSTLVLPQATSIVIGTGNRSKESEWNIKQEFNESIDIATFSYPAAAEFRDGNTAHYDLLFIVKPENEDPNYKQQLAQIKKNPALLKAAREIYGDSFAFEITSNRDKRFEKVSLGEETYYLNKNAYNTRTINVLKTVLLAADAQMLEQGLGQTIQLKGLGLGAFSFTGAENSKVLQALYIQCVIEALKELQAKKQLKHINCVNLINLPGDYTDPTLNTNVTKQEAIISGIKLLRSVMDPTTNKYKAKVGEIGAVVVCGDSGSKFGNEGNIGLNRDSSDDPAAQYSLLNPLILDPDSNPVLQKKSCIHLVNNGHFKPMPEPKFEIKKLPLKTIGGVSTSWWNIALVGTGIALVAALLFPTVIAQTSVYGLGFIWGIAASSTALAQMMRGKTNSSNMPKHLAVNRISNLTADALGLKQSKHFTPARNIVRHQEINRQEVTKQYALKPMRIR